MSFLFWSILVPIIIIGVLVFLHELGHFLVAKWCGVGVVRFAVGFGPAIYKKRIGETEYRLGCIPLGGYVRMVGDISDYITGPDTTPAENGVSDVPPELLADKSKWFIEKSLWQRSAIVAAGPIFNFVTGLIFVAVAIFIYGDVDIKEGSIIGTIAEGSPAQSAGLKEGDEVRKFNGEAISKWEELAGRMHRGTGEPVTLTVARGVGNGITEELEIVVQPQSKKLPGLEKEVFIVGISPKIDRKAVGLGQSIVQGGKWIAFTTGKTFEGIYGMFSGQVSPKELAGPVFIFGAATQAAQKGMEYVLDLMAHLSVSLAVLNLLPIPVLDGGHLLFFLLEGLFGPLSLRKKEIANQVGLALLLTLMGVALTNDIRRTQEPEKKVGIEWKAEEKK